MQKKTGQGKYVVVPYSPEVFFIHRAYPIKEGKIGLPTYSVEDADSRAIIGTNNEFIKFCQSDLLKVNPEGESNITQAHANKLNQTHEGFNILRKGDLDPKPVEPKFARQPKKDIAPLDYKKKE